MTGTAFGGRAVLAGLTLPHGLAVPARLAVPAVLAVLAVLTVLDGMFAGFRASCGRTGLIRHRRADLVAAARGLALQLALLAPVAVLAGLDASTGTGRWASYRAGARGMLDVYLPYGLVVLLALAGYVTLGWRNRFVASAVLLGPLTLARPLVAVLGAVAAARNSHDPRTTLAAGLAVTAVLLVEPLAGRFWYRPAPSATA